MLRHRPTRRAHRVPVVRVTSLLIGSFALAGCGARPSLGNLQGNGGGGFVPTTSAGGFGSGGGGGEGSTQGGAGGSVAGGGGSAAGGASVDASAPPAGGAGNGGSAGAGADAGGAVDATAPNSDAGSDAGPVLASCGAPQPLARRWDFSSDIEGWEVTGGGNPTLSWSASAGEVDGGALFTRQAGAAAEARYVDSFGDLSGRVLRARVRLTTAGSVTATLYAQSGNGLDWGEGAAVALLVDQWQCLSLDFSSPAFGPDFDATDVRRIGLSLNGDGGTTVAMDFVGM